jgi:hypothetical protein
MVSVVPRDSIFPTNNNHVNSVSSSLSNDFELLAPFLSPTENSVSIRKCSRVRCLSGYLQDFHCQLATSSTSFSSNPLDNTPSPSGVPY